MPNSVSIILDSFYNVVKTYTIWWKHGNRVQGYDSIMGGNFCIGFIDFMLKGKSLLHYTNIFSPNDYEKNNKIILKHFQ